MSNRISRHHTNSSIPRLPLILSTLGTLALSLPLQAQTAPDAGSLLRQQPRPPAVTPAQPQQIVPAAPAAQQPDAGPRVLVQGFRIQGAVLISEAELAAQLQGVVGKELSLRQLKAVSAVLTAYYAQRGYLARVFVPPQDVKDGIVTLQVIEGRRGNVRVTPQGELIDADRVAGFIDYRLARGEAFDLVRLGEALNILNEQPGLEARATLAPGQGEAEIDLAVAATAKPVNTGFLGLNNHGSLATGEAQASAGLALHNTSGHFDTLSLLLNGSEGTSYGRVDYSQAVGHSGLRLGANASHLHYRIVQASLSALKSNGSAITTGLSASYPLARRTDLSLSLQANYDEKRLVDQTVAGETGNRRVSVTGLGLSGYVVGGSLLPDGITSFGLGYVAGESDQRNAAALASDEASRQVQGSFSKLSYNLGYLQPLAEAWRFNATLRGQIASKNLDSSERFSLGGPSGVRAYAIGEATGDEGWLLSLNLSRQLQEALSASVFVDTGSVKLNRNTWAGWNAGNPGLDNSYGLSAIGAGLDWRINAQALLSASVATAVGDNPARDASGNNIDGKDNRTRAWVSLNAQF